MITGISIETCRLIDYLVSNNMVEVNTNTGVITTIKYHNDTICIKDKYTTSYQNNKGYYYKRVYKENKLKLIYDHQIIAFIKYGYNMVGFQVDHINNSHNMHRYNKPDNLQLLSAKLNRTKRRKLDIIYNNKVIVYKPTIAETEKVRKSHIIKNIDYKIKLVIYNTGGYAINTIGFNSYDELTQSKEYQRAIKLNQKISLFY